MCMASVCRTVTVNRPHSGPAAVTVNLTSGDLAAVLQGTLSPLQVMEHHCIGCGYKVGQVLCTIILLIVWI